MTDALPERSFQIRRDESYPNHFYCMTDALEEQSFRIRSDESHPNHFYCSGLARYVRNLSPVAISSKKR